LTAGEIGEKNYGSIPILLTVRSKMPLPAAMRRERRGMRVRRGIRGGDLNHWRKDLREDTVKKLFKLCALGTLMAVGAGLTMTGCKSTPELSKDNAQALIQSHYDAQTPSGITITVDKQGLQQGLTAGYWKLTKIYPKQQGWADYTLTDEGKKALKLNGGGDVIEWRPGGDGEFHFMVVTSATSTMKAKDLQDPQDEVLAGASNAKSVSFTETVNMTSLPKPLQDMAHNPGNKLSSKKQADLSYENGAWKVHGIV